MTQSPQAEQGAEGTEDEKQTIAQMQLRRQMVEEVHQGTQQTRQRRSAGGSEIGQPEITPGSLRRRHLVRHSPVGGAGALPPPRRRRRSRHPGRC